MKMPHILHRPFCSGFYSRVIRRSHTELVHTSPSIFKKFIFLSIVLLCSEISISFSSPLSRSIKLDSQYAVAADASRTNSVCILDTKFPNKPLSYLFLNGQNPGHQVHRFFEGFVNAVELALSTNRKFVPRFLIQDDRVMPYILLKISPRMAHGPPHQAQGKIEIFYIEILSTHFSHYRLFNHNPTFLAKSAYLDNKRIIILNKYCDRVSFEELMDGVWDAVEIGSLLKYFRYGEIPLPSGKVT